jgi:hypothetical protein
MALYGCETWSLTLREERRLRMFENRALRGGLGKLYDNKLRDLYSSSNVIRIIKSKRMRLSGHVGRMREKGNVYRLLVRKPER